MKIGICGGTFDPFHRGHLDPILAVRDEMEWTHLIYVPAWQQPFKSGREHASGYHRFAMAVLATEAHDDVFVSPMELERGGVSYTVDTLEELRAQYPDAALDWIIGDDNLDGLEKWKNIARIRELARFVVLTRNTKAASREAGLPHSEMVYARNEAVPVSSTEIRKRIREGRTIEGLVDPRVSRYIQNNSLYREVQT
jgi:nicotinate-nucleotide adenylyltransferase